MALTASLGKVRIAKLEVCLGRDERHWRCVWETNDMLDVHGRDKQCWMYMGKMCYGQVEINIEWGGSKKYSVDADAGVWARIAILGPDI